MWKCCIEYLSVDISLVEVVPFIACHELASGTCKNGTTSAIGTDKYSSNLEQMHDLHFGIYICNFILILGI
ncbi:MAG: hypothetical protein E7206_02850 [Clostridium beijerinckii]|nr:hypothetical protein [Clostridium beijerinckii]